MKPSIRSISMSLFFCGLAVACQLPADTVAVPLEPTPPATIQAEATSILYLPQEAIVIFSPQVMQEISGGEIQVSGYSQYYFEATLSLALCGEGGTGAPNAICGTEDNVLALGIATIDSPDMGIPGPFQGSLSYQVLQPVTARLAVYALSPRDGSIEHLSSVLLKLNP